MAPVPAAPSLSAEAETTRVAKRFLLDRLGAPDFAAYRLTRADGRRDLILNRVKTAVPEDSYVYVSHRGIKHIVEDHPRKGARERFVDYALATLRQPSEVWMQRVHYSRTGHRHRRRCFLGRFRDGRNMVVVDHQDQPHHHLLWTFYEATERQVEFDLDRFRQGQLLWSRPSENR